MACERSARELDPDVGPVPVGGVGAATMRSGDRLDDRQAKPGAVAATGRVGAAEALEGAVEELRWEPRAAIGDVDLEVVVGHGGAQGDLPRSVLDRVLNQVG